MKQRTLDTMLVVLVILAIALTVRAQSRQVALAPGESIEVVCRSATATAAPTNTPAPAPTGTATATAAPTPTAAPGPTPTAFGMHISLGSSYCGQTVTIADGDYARLWITARCTQSNPLVVQAQTDGGARFDGRSIAGCGSGLCPVLRLSGAQWVTLRGLVAHHSQDMVVQVTGSSDVRLERVTAYQAGPDYGDHVVEIYRSTGVTLQDCAATGRGRNAYIAYESDRIVFRRCFARYVTNGTQLGADMFQIYGSADCLIESCVGTRLPSSVRVDVNQYWYASYNRDVDTVDRNRTVGCVFYGYDYHGLNVISANGQLHDNRVENSVFIGSGAPSGIFQRCDDGFVMDRLTLVNHGNAVWLSHDTSNPRYPIAGALSNSSIVNATTGLLVEQAADVTLVHRDNNFWNVGALYQGAVAGDGETTIDPGYDVDRYGLGAYLVRPAGFDRGALVIYDQAGVPLWPWPLEARICAETANILGAGVSVTWVSQPAQYDYDRDGAPETYACTGGIWKDLEGIYE